MTKIIGAVLIVAAFSLAGAARGAELRKRAGALAALVSALELLRCEVVDRLTPVPEIAERLGASGPEETRGFFRRLSAELAGLGEREFSEIWASCAEELALGGEERQTLLDLGRSLGRYGAEAQNAAISRCMSLLEASARQAREEAASGAKLYGGLGVTAGLLLAVTLI